MDIHRRATKLVCVYTDAFDVIAVFRGYAIATGDTTLSDSGPSVEMNCNFTLGFSSQADTEED